MADKKISQLTGATTPVAGTEVLPIVQGGSTVKVSIANLTAGRSISSAGASLDGAVTINDSGADVDFRVEGDTDANLLFADASTDRVAVGVNNPAAKFHVSGQSRFADSSNAANYITIGAGASAPYGNASISTTTAGLAIVAEGAGTLTIVNNGVEGVRINSNTEVVVNENSANLDFRVEGDTDANLLFVDASTDRIGIGTATPAQKVHVAGNARFTGSQVGTKIENQNTAVSVSAATTILDEAGALGRFAIVNGASGGDRFCDLVLCSTAVSPTVVSSFTAFGSPAARTYTRSGGALQLAMASGTYDVQVIAIGV
jgi:hypothetical protein